ncbi:ISAs1 family transposase [Kineosporia mesophila]|uniref:ISAs1 family transposase n=1 Tax=Kineosporia mesophila TaxID=566012 RepID=A0ABP6ZLT6_9ACTN|nr:ISAs1 family transposase [Kineosporia mesophila]
MEVFAQVSDPRACRGVRHSVAGVLAAGLSATLAGARSFDAIAQWSAETDPDLLGQLGLNRSPSEATFRRVITAADGDELDALLGAFFHTRIAASGGRRVIAIDGKTVRGARTRTSTGARAPHLVSALEHQAGAVLGQVSVEARSNEIPAARTLLSTLENAGMLTGAVVTLDAMHTQTETAAQIVAGGADYVLTVKANQKNLFQACKRLPWKHIPTQEQVQTGHGRRAHRAIKVTTVPAWIEFSGATQIAKIRRTTTRPNSKRSGRMEKTVEIVYVITSAGHREAPADVLASWVQHHWCIENRLHWVRDVTFDEDRSQIRTGSAPRVMATLRSAAISLHRLHDPAINIAAALRHHGRHPGKAIMLLTSEKGL